MAEQDWSRAIELWDLVIGRSGRNPAWFKARALCHSKLGRHRQSFSDYRVVLESAPDDMASVAGLVRAVASDPGDHLERDARLQVALQALSSSIFRADASAALKRIGHLIVLNQVEAARDALEAIIGNVDSIDQFDMCLNWTPVIMPPFMASRHAGMILDKVRSARRGALDDVARWRHAYVELRILLALEQADEFIRTFHADERLLRHHQHHDDLARICRRLTAASEEIYLERKVFGIGLSKTGTTSLSKALTILGIDSIHWQSPITKKLLDEFSIFYSGGACDTPISSDFETLMRLYPNSVFIYTTRPHQSWIASMEGHYIRKTSRRSIDEIRPVIMDAANWRYGQRSSRIHWDLYLQHASFDAAFQRHDERVAAAFEGRQDRLLRFDMFSGDGWETLCSFLGRPAPSSGFPRENVTRRPV